MQKLPDYITVASPSKQMNTQTIYIVLSAIVKLFNRVAKSPLKPFNYTQGSYDFYCEMTKTGSQTLESLGNGVSFVGHTIASFLR